MNHPLAPDTSTPQAADGPELPVAEAWFTARAVDESITLITEPHVHPFLQANTWYIRGRDRNVLIDCGLGVASLRTAFPDLFDRETILVVTHAHLDHMGSAHEFEHCWAQVRRRMPSFSCRRVHTCGRPGLMPCGSNGSSRAHWPFVRSPRPTARDHQRTRSTLATDPSRERYRDGGNPTASTPRGSTGPSSGSLAGSANACVSNSRSPSGSPPL
ncbi:MBL fold metallo-hydrolase [Streptomyces sp. NPDC090075]|uniref:MBL fold metallo-hydrolase n=1 Tax=Streptomyces sp. NPDC090075 TaxID=3365937 RepID=UPI0037FD434A